jgi:hypothetical protein
MASNRLFYCFFIEVFCKTNKAGCLYYFLQGREEIMRKRFALLAILTVALVAMVGFVAVGYESQGLTCVACNGVVDKAPCEAFTVKVTFKNTGKTEGTWSVNIAFEGEKWNWNGTSQTLTLKPYYKKTLTWNGSVPCDAPIDSVARLIVYYDDSFVPLDWWIHVVSGAELTVTSSTVE